MKNKGCFGMEVLTSLWGSRPSWILIKDFLSSIFSDLFEWQCEQEYCVYACFEGIG